MDMNMDKDTTMEMYIHMNNNRLDNKRIIDEFSASTTVEITFIIPVFLFTIFAVLWLLFFLYARIKLEADLNRAVTEVSEVLAVEGVKESERIMTDVLSKYIRDYPYFKVYDSFIGIDHGNVTATASLQANVVYGGILGIFTEDMRSTKGSASVKYWNCPKIKRIISVILHRSEGS